MAIDYSKIKNKKLVELLQGSPALELLSDTLKQGYIDKVVGLSDKEEVQLVQALEKQAKTLPKLSNKEKIAIFENGIRALKSMMKSFNKETLKVREKVDEKESSKEQQNLLDELENT